MRHKWKNIKNEYIKYRNKDVYVHDTKICVRCGLKKGTIRIAIGWSFLIYFKHGDVLSENTLPFECNSWHNDMFFSKEDFEI